MNVRPGTDQSDALSRAMVHYTRYLSTDEALHSLGKEGVERDRRAIREMQEKQNRELRRGWG